jgi:hypothetical protein
MKHKLHNNRFVTNLLKPHTEKKIAASARFSNLTTLTAMRKLFLFMLLMNSALFTKAQTQVRMTLANPIQISDHEFEFDVFIKNSGTTSLGLVNYSFGVDYAPGLANGGILSYTYIAGSRNAAFAGISNIASIHSAQHNQFKFTTASSMFSTAAVNLPIGTPMKLARMRVSNTVAFANCTQPNLSLHMLSGTGYTQCIAVCYVAPNTTIASSIIGSSNAPSTNLILGLIGENLPTPLTLATLTLCPPPTVTSTQATACGSYTWAATGLTYTASGQYTQNTLTNCICYNTQILNLTIHSATSSTQTASATGSYTWPVNGVTYTASGTYTATLTNSVGCDSLRQLMLTIITTQSTLQLRCFITGYWAGNNSMNPVLLNQGILAPSTSCDTITVDLHSSVSPYPVVATSHAILQTNGWATCYFPVSTGQYYIDVKHRNAVEVWSAAPVSFGTSTVSYDFTNSSGKAYGNNMYQVSPGVWALYSGDIYKDDNIDLIDLVTVEADIYGFLYGYQASDLNGDGNVDLLDSPALEANVESFIYFQRP